MSWTTFIQVMIMGIVFGTMAIVGIESCIKSYRGRPR